MSSEPFESLFRTHHAPLCAYVNAFVHAPDVADEIVQELFLQVWREWRGIPPADNHRAWLFAAARNRALNHLKRQRVEERFLIHATADSRSTGGTASDAGAIANELSEAVSAALSELSPRAREAAELRWRHHLSYREISDIMRISVKSVENHLVRVRDSMRVMLARFDDEGGE